MKEQERSASERALSPRIHRDLDALSAQSRQDTPPLEQTLNTLSGRRPGSTWEDRLMEWTRGFSRRPRLAVMGATLAVAATLLVVPISYDKVVGHEISLTVGGNGINETVIGDIAAQFQAALGVDTVQLGVTSGNGERRYALDAAVPDRNAAAVSKAFARTLTEKGYTAESTTHPITERVSSNVYAMAFDNVVRVEMEGKSAAELEAEIAAALAAAGVPNATVSVTRNPNETKIEIQAEAMGDPERISETPIHLMLTEGGQTLGGTETETETSDIGIQMMRTEGAGGVDRLTVEVREGTTTYTATVEDPASLDDAALAEAVREQLAAQGVPVSVTAEDGRLRVMRLDSSGSPATGVQPTTWGKLKNDMKTRTP